MPGKKKKPSGSPGDGEPAFLAIGKVRRSHGVHGEMVAELYTDFPERLKVGRSVFVGEQHTTLVLFGIRVHNEGSILAFEGINTPEAASKYRNQVIYTSVKDLPDLSPGEFYFHELIGMDVRDESNTILGVLSEIIETGANDVYVISTPEGKELLLPAIPDVILEIDIKNRRIHVHILPGLVDGTAEEV